MRTEASDLIRARSIIAAPRGFARAPAAGPACCNVCGRPVEPDVEALLVNRVGTARQYYVAPIDRCYALAGLMHLKWRGMSGGPDVWEAIAQFFAELDASGGAEPELQQQSRNIARA